MFKNFAKTIYLLRSINVVMLKQIMIPVAAFAVTVTGASAFTGDGYMLDKLDILSSDEQAAFEEAREIRETSRAEARQVLEDAGIDDERMEEIHTAMREAREAHRAEIDQILEDGDYDAFVEAVADSPLAEQITSEADFEKFVEAHELRQAGDFTGAQAIMDELGIERPQRGPGMGSKHGGRGMGDGDGDGFGQKGNWGNGYRQLSETE